MPPNPKTKPNSEWESNKSLEDLLKEFDENVAKLPMLIDDVPGFFKDNPNSLYGETIYPETILELDAEKLKSFITQAYTEGENKGWDEAYEKGWRDHKAGVPHVSWEPNKQSRLSTLDEVIKEVEGMKKAPPPTNDIPFDWGIEDSETHYKRLGFNQALDSVKQIINKMKGK